jgi:hypothetical protein
MVRELPTPQDAEDIDEACAALLRFAHCRGESFGIEVFARADGVIELTLRDGTDQTGHRYAFVHGFAEKPTHELRKLLETYDAPSTQAPPATVAPPAPAPAQKGRSAA